MVAWVKPGSEFRVECVDWTGGQIKDDDSATDVKVVDLTKVHYLSGPIGVEGAEPGDLLVCDILDVGVDLRHGSPTYGQWEARELSDENMHALFVPVGFAHGFCVLSDVADVIYKQTAYYDPELERGIAWNDPDIAIAWPLPEQELTISERDVTAPLLRELKDELPFVYEGA